MRKRKIGRPTKKQQEKREQEFFNNLAEKNIFGDLQAKLKPQFEISQGEWTISGRGSLKELQNLLNQLEGK